MDSLTGVLVTVSALLALAGGLKVARPDPASRALRSLRLPATPGLVRLLGLGELLVAFATLVIGGTGAFALQAACYAAFVVVAAVFWRRGELPSCGCFGEVESPPSLVHVAVTALGAALSAVAAVNGAGAPVDRPWALVAGLAALPLVYLVLVDLPRLLAATALHRGGSTSRDSSTRPGAAHAQAHAPQPVPPRETASA
jgi:hypothetical protein